MASLPAVPLAAFKNILVTVTEDKGQLIPNCVELISCTSKDTLINFQIAEPATDLIDYRFEPPEVTGDVKQLGSFTISPSGKMLTVCNSVSAFSVIHITLKVYDHKAPQKRGAFDPEVANQPDGN